MSVKTNPAFVLKVRESALAYKQVDLMAFHLPPFLSPEEERLHCLCPVPALRCYVNRTKALRKSNKLLVSRLLQKRLAVHRALCPSTLIERRRGKKDAVEKKCTSNRDNRTLERIVKQNPFKNVGEIRKE